LGCVGTYDAGSVGGGQSLERGIIPGVGHDRGAVSGGKEYFLFQSVR
jgi:hypothetical protein